MHALEPVLIAAIIVFVLNATGSFIEFNNSFVTRWWTLCCSQLFSAHSLIALDVEAGELAWYYQAIPHDTRLRFDAFRGAHDAGASSIVQLTLEDWKKQRGFDLRRVTV